MKSIKELAHEIVAREGGYVNDPDDPGGETNFGVTIGTMRRLGLDLNRDGAVDGRDMRALTADRAAEIYVCQCRGGGGENLAAPSDADGLSLRR